MTKKQTQQIKQIWGAISKQGEKGLEFALRLNKIVTGAQNDLSQAAKLLRSASADNPEQARLMLSCVKSLEAFELFKLPREESADPEASKRCAAMAAEARSGLMAFMAPSFGYQSEKRQWVEFICAAADAGFIPEGMHLHSTAHFLSFEREPALSSSEVLSLAERGFYKIAGDYLSARSQSRHSFPIASGFRPFGPEQRKALSRLMGMGAFEPGDGMICSASDMLCGGADEAAVAIVQSGAPWGSTPHGTWSRSGNGISPYESAIYALGDRLNELQSRAKQRSAVDNCAKRLHEMRLASEKAGNPLLESGSKAFALLAKIPLSYMSGGPFIDGSLRSPLDPAIFEPAWEALVKAGADPNSSKHLARAIGELLGLAAIAKYKEQVFDPFLKFAISKGFSTVEHGPSIASSAMESICWRRQDDSFMISMLDELRGLGIDFKTFPAKGPSPYPAIVRSNSFKCFAKAVELGAPLDFQTGRGETLLARLCASSRSGARKAFKEAIKNPKIAALRDVQSTWNGHSALHEACASMDLEAIKGLLSIGADPNIQDSNGDTPLRHLLRRWGKKAEAAIMPCLEAMVEAGADISIPNKKGQTPAQAGIGVAPLAAIEALISKRPQDLLESKSNSKAAKKRLEKRAAAGGRALSERIQLKAEMGDLDGNEQAQEEAKPRASNRHRL